jgi:hypothetical protein
MRQSNCVEEYDERTPCIPSKVNLQKASLVHVESVSELTHKAFSQQSLLSRDVYTHITFIKKCRVSLRKDKVELVRGTDWVDKTVCRTVQRFVVKAMKYMTPSLSFLKSVASV